MVSSTTTDLANLGNTVFGGGGQKFAAISATAHATNVTEIVAAVTKVVDAEIVAKGKIRVLALYMSQEANTNSTYQWLSATTAITGVVPNKNIDLVLVLPFNPAGWFETAAGEALNLHPVTKNAFGTLVYEEVAST